MSAWDSLGREANSASVEVMENKTNKTTSDFLNKEVLKIENRLFWSRILGSSIGYLLMTLWLNSIRVTASLWIVWVLIIVQFAIYFSIFITSYQRSKVFGLNKNISLVLFIALAVFGRVNDWEIVIIPLLVIVMLVFSVMNKKVSEKGRAMTI